MRCPGQDTRYWKPDAIFEVKCLQCGQNVEFFKDEPARKCRHCGHKVINPRMDFGCAAYCKFAKECLGETGFLAQRDDLLKNRVAIEMKNYFQKDFKRIGHATKVARYAEKIAGQTGGDLAVVLSAAYLHDIGIKEAERKYNSTAARYQEEEGPPIARDILTRLGASRELIDEVCDIIGHHHHPRSEETVNFKALYDADMITNLEEHNKRSLEEKKSPEERKKTADIIDQALLTGSGRELARSVLDNGPSHLSEDLKSEDRKSEDRPSKDQAEDQAEDQGEKP